MLYLPQIISIIEVLLVAVPVLLIVAFVTLAPSMHCKINFKNLSLRYH